MSPRALSRLLALAVPVALALPTATQSQPAAGGWKQRSVLAGQRGPLCRLAFSPDGTVLAVARSMPGDREPGSPPVVQLWPAGPRPGVGRPLDGHNCPVARVGFGSGGAALVSVGLDGKVVRWEVRSGRAVSTFSVGDGLERAWLSATGKTLTVSYKLAGGLGGDLNPKVRVWNVETGKQLGVLNLPVTHRARAVSSHAKLMMTSTVYTPIPGGDGVGVSEMAFWDVASGRRTGAVRALPVTGALFAPNAKTVLVRHLDPTNGLTKVVFWNVVTKKARVPGNAAMLRAADAAYSADGNFLATVSAGGRGVVIWDLRADRAVGSLDGLAAQVVRVALSPDGGQAAVALADNTVRLFARGR
jgi:WD40 repeat protein